MSEVTNEEILMERLKELRGNAIEVFTDKVRELNADKALDAHDVLTSSAAAAIDHMAIGTLNTLFDNPDLFVQEQTIEVVGSNDYKVTTQFTPGLADMYLQQVST